MAVATSQGTMLIDTRYAKQPLLHWNWDLESETQRHVSFLPPCLQPKNECKTIPISFSFFFMTLMIYTVLHIKVNCLHVIASFMTWGRIHAEVLLYNYKTAQSLPPVCKNVQLIPTYPSHRHYWDPAFNPTRFKHIKPPQTIGSRYNNQERRPNWPACIGNAVIPFFRSDMSDKDGMTIK
jgi:hypothetical protein